MKIYIFSEAKKESHLHISGLALNKQWGLYVTLQKSGGNLFFNSLNNSRLEMCNTSIMITQKTRTY
jgi:hypothetical protein